MKNHYTVLLWITFILVSGFIHAQPTLNYQRLTNGLDFPDFDEGRTVFKLNGSMKSKQTTMLKIYRTLAINTVRKQSNQPKR